MAGLADRGDGQDRRHGGPGRPRPAKALWRTAPQRILRPHLVNYELDRLKVLDIGSSYGQALSFFGPGSVGFDFEVPGVDFCRDALGLEAHVCDLYSDALFEFAPRRSFDAIWFSHVLEHLNSPHVALMRLRQCLKDGGLLFVTVPVIPSAPIVALWKSLMWLSPRVPGMPRLNSVMNYLSSDHINAFTPATIRFFIDRAGFRVERLSTTLPSDPARHRSIGPWFVPFFDVTTVIARVDHTWQYHPKACREVDDVVGWRYRGKVGDALSIATAEDGGESHG